jgi:hypothetical protein
MRPDWACSLLACFCLSGPAAYLSNLVLISAVSPMQPHNTFTNSPSHPSANRPAPCCLRPAPLLCASTCYWRLAAHLLAAAVYTPRGSSRPGEGHPHPHAAVRHVGGRPQWLSLSASTQHPDAGRGTWEPGSGTCRRGTLQCCASSRVADNT